MKFISATLPHALSITNVLPSMQIFFDQTTKKFKLENLSKNNKIPSFSSIQSFLKIISNSLSTSEFSDLIKKDPVSVVFAY